MAATPHMRFQDTLLLQKQQAQHDEAREEWERLFGHVADLVAHEYVAVRAFHNPLARSLARIADADVVDSLRLQARLRATHASGTSSGTSSTAGVSQTTAQPASVSGTVPPSQPQPQTSAMAPSMSQQHGVNPPPAPSQAPLHQQQHHNGP